MVAHSKGKSGDRALRPGGERVWHPALRSTLNARRSYRDLTQDHEGDSKMGNREGNCWLALRPNDTFTRFTPLAMSLSISTIIA